MLGRFPNGTKQLLEAGPCKVCSFTISLKPISSFSPLQPPWKSRCQTYRGVETPHKMLSMPAWRSRTPGLGWCLPTKTKKKSPVWLKMEWQVSRLITVLPGHMESWALLYCFLLQAHSKNNRNLFKRWRIFMCCPRQHANYWDQLISTFMWSFHLELYHLQATFCMFSKHYLKTGNT